MQPSVKFAFVCSVCIELAVVYTRRGSHQRIFTYTPQQLTSTIEHAVRKRRRAQAQGGYVCRNADEENAHPFPQLHRNLQALRKQNGNMTRPNCFKTDVVFQSNLAPILLLQCCSHHSSFSFSFASSGETREHHSRRKDHKREQNEISERTEGALEKNKGSNKNEQKCKKTEEQEKMGKKPEKLRSTRIDKHHVKLTSWDTSCFHPAFVGPIGC